MRYHEVVESVFILITANMVFITLHVIRLLFCQSYLYLELQNFLLFFTRDQEHHDLLLATLPAIESSLEV